jgi:gliding motility-associated-like protein
LEVPNSFSPNGDGVLDAWIIRGLSSYASNNLVIFTKWGEVVLDVDNYNNDWQGIRGFNEELPEGIYYYRLTLEGAETLTGYIMLKR